MTTRKGHGGLANNIPFKKPKLQMQVNMWGDCSDEDDDLILLASQAAEQNQPDSPTNFTSFVKEVEKDLRTSTQQIFNDPMPSQTPIPPVSVNVALRTKMTSNLVLNQNQASQDFLRKRIKSLEEDVHKFKEECQAAVEKIEIKDYELSSLRYEAKELQKANSELRLKLVKNEQFNKEIQRNKVMEKQLEKMEWEVGQKNIELIKLRNDRRSSQVAAPLPVDIISSGKNDAAADTNLFHLNVLFSRFEITRADSWQIRLSHRILQIVEEDAGTAVFTEQFSQLQRHIGLILMGQLGNVKQFVGHILKSMELARNIINKQFDSRGQIQAAKSPRSSSSHTSSSTNTNISTIILPEVNTRIDACIYDKEAMFEDEELIIFRRILSILALACKCSGHIRTTFYDSSICDSLLEIINGLSRKPDEYQHRTSGIIHASTVLLVNLIEAGGHPEKIPLLFRAIVFARLDSFSLFMLFKALRSMSVETTRSLLCLSGANTTISKEYSINYNVAQFTRDSCLLQVLATSIECAFPGANTTSDYWSAARYQKLLAMTRCFIRFFRRNIRHMSWDWFTVSPTCVCYQKLTTSFVVLIHLCLHLFETVPNMKAEIREVQTVSQLALLLMHDIFTANLNSAMIQQMGRPLKNRMVAVYNLLMKFNHLFHFRLAQVKALESFDVKLIANSFKVESGQADAGGGACSEQQRDKAKLVFDSISV